MSKASQYIIGILAVLTLGVLMSMYLVSNMQVSVGSVAAGQEYNSTTTTSNFVSATSITQLKNGAGAFGSVIVASSSPITSYPTIIVYDATSTMATSSAKVLAQFGTNNQTHGTYVFDITFSKGLSVEVPSGFDGIYTITWR